MNTILDLIRRFFSELRFWFVVAPWERALRVRAGKYVRSMGPGVHFRVPGLDVVLLQSIRTRVSNFGRQTVATTDGKIVTFSGSVGYEITDLRLLYEKLHHAEDTLINLTRARAAQYVATHAFAECTPQSIEHEAEARLDFKQFGLSLAKVYITDFAVVRTFRLIGDVQGHYSYGGSLSTEGKA